MTTKSIPPQPDDPPQQIPPRPISALQLAKHLIASEPAKNEFRLEEFLLWPPDLFAFTSLILSITGAYHMVVSPPRYDVPHRSNLIWPPPYEPGTSWAKHVRSLGQAWRLSLQPFKKKEFIAFKQANGPDNKALRLDFISRKAGLIDSYSPGQNAEARAKCKWTPTSETWVPGEVGEFLVKLYRTMDEEWIGNIEDLMCDAQDDVGKEKNWPAFEALMTLHAIADEACEGWGIRTMADDDAEEGQKPQKRPAQQYAEERLEDCGTLATIDNQRGRVLPKRHTPSVGITLRSVSANLAFHRSSVDVKWSVFQHENPKGGPPLPSNALIDRMTSRGQKEDKSNDALSILLLPWPLKVHSLDFAPRSVDHLERTGRELDFFCYSPKEGPRKEFERNLEDALEAALLETEVIDMVVFPECALTKESVGWLEGILQKDEYRVSCYIAGVRDDPQQDDSETASGADSPRGKRCFVDNMVYFKMGSRNGDRFEFPAEGFPEQHKHHRWKLNPAQLKAYQLGHILSPQREWWEASKLRRRKVNFINIGDELTICPLICEDLARQDPIADLIRTAGPSLVVTILMDGPQRKDRWPAKYASVLAEDPGSAVVTLTSSGMVDRWRSSRGGPSRAVALWSDDGGKAQEIELEKDAIGILLTLYFKPRPEPTADGRASETNVTNALLLSGIHQIRIPRVPL